METKPEQGIHLGGEVFPHRRHVCGFFYSQEEQYDVLLPFIEEGLAQGERAFHIVDPARRQEHLTKLRTLRLDTLAAERQGQIEVRVWEEAYLRGGAFSQEAMLALIEEVLGGPEARQFPLTRLIANMEWALEDLPGVNDLVEYETRLNFILPKYKDPVI